MLQVDRPTYSRLLELLESHPEVRLTETTSPAGTLTFEQCGRRRVLRYGQETLGGLIEIEDNNPLVCADDVSIPNAAATLLWVALGPLFRAGLILEPPVFQTNAPESPLPPELEVEGAFEVEEGGSVYAGQAMAVVPTLDDWGDIDLLYEEAYGRSFYVRRIQDGDWHPSLVSNRPFAAYRIRLTPDDHRSLLTVQVMADKEGKCGACQVVHTLNVMAGFEECLGIPDSW